MIGPALTNEEQDEVVRHLRKIAASFRATAPTPPS